jgi:hypothetical protein
MAKRGLMYEELEQLKQSVAELQTQFTELLGSILLQEICMHKELSNVSWICWDGEFSADIALDPLQVDILHSIFSSIGYPVLKIYRKLCVVLSDLRFFALVGD